jgi:hypothetical protein
MRVRIVFSVLIVVGFVIAFLLGQSNAGSTQKNEEKEKGLIKRVEALEKARENFEKKNVISKVETLEKDLKKVCGSIGDVGPSDIVGKWTIKVFKKDGKGKYREDWVDFKEDGTALASTKNQARWFLTGRVLIMIYGGLDNKSDDVYPYVYEVGRNEDKSVFLHGMSLHGYFREIGKKDSK